MKLIGIHGKALSGKDTVASMLMDDHGFGQMSFANPLKLAAAVIFGWDPAICYSQEGKKQYSEYWETTVRQALQDFGEGIRKLFGEDFWIKRWGIDYSKVMNTHDIVISDVRYENEAEAIRGFGGVILHLRRPGAGLEGAQGQHSSEAGIQIHSNDLVLHNTGTLDDLRTSVRGLLEFMSVPADGKPN